MKIKKQDSLKSLVHAHALCKAGKTVMTPYKLWNYSLSISQLYS